MLRGVNIDHVNLQVSNLDRSVEVLPRAVQSVSEERGSRAPLSAGPGRRIVVSERPTARAYFCVGVEDFEPERVANALREAGLDRNLRVGQDNVYVSDPDDIRVQISWPEWRG